MCVCACVCSGLIKKGDRILSMREISDPEPLPGGFFFLENKPHLQVQKSETSYYHYILYVTTTTNILKHILVGHELLLLMGDDITGIPDTCAKHMPETSYYYSFSRSLLLPSRSLLHYWNIRHMC